MVDIFQEEMKAKEKINEAKASVEVQRLMMRTRKMGLSRLLAAAVALGVEISEIRMQREGQLMKSNSLVMYFFGNVLLTER